MTPTDCRRCDWQPDREAAEPPREQLREHALTAGHPLCTCCARSLASADPALACEQCLTGAREHLAGILVMALDLEGHLGHAKGQAYDRPPGGAEEHALPGGTVLALLGPGSNGSAPDSRGGRTHGVDNDSGDPVSVSWALESWVQDWYETRGWVDDMPAPRVPQLQGYLEVHARWAANRHGAFAEWAQDMRDLHVRLQQATGRLRRPVKAGAECFACSGPLYRQVTTEGLEEDEVTCRECGERYDPARYRLALKAAAQAASRFTQDDEEWATPAVLSDQGLPQSTIRSWRQRGQVRGIVKAGVLFVSVEDVRARASERAA